MQPFIAIYLSANPTADDLRKAREVLALMRNLSNAADRAPAADEDDDAPPAATVPPPPPVAALPNPETAFQTNVSPPSATANAPSVTAGTPAHDSSGFPHDERIHSGNKTLNQDGTWKKRKGVDDATIAAVRAELAAAGKTVAVTTPPVPVAPPPPVPAAVAPPPPPAPGADDPFKVLMAKFLDGVKAKTWAPGVNATACAAVGVANFPALNTTHRHLIPAVSAYFDALAGGMDDATAAAMAQTMVPA